MPKTTTAFAPCNITGFFQVHDRSSDPLSAGSTGASIAVTEGVETKVWLKRSGVSRFRIAFNGKPLSRNSTSNDVATRLARIDGRDWEIKITHESSLPMGCGYGTSGAGALSLSLALNEAMGLGLSKVEAAQIAHVSEIACRTGLGTVVSVFSGGVTLRSRPGAPGVGRIVKMRIAPTTRVVSASFGPLSTPRVLRSRIITSKVNSCGRGLVKRLEQQPSASALMRLSGIFSNCLGLASHRLSKVMTALNSAGFKTSMMMLGESLFGLFPAENVPRVETLLRANHIVPVVSTIARSGGHLT